MPGSLRTLANACHHVLLRACLVALAQSHPACAPLPAALLRPRCRSAGHLQETPSWWSPRTARLESGRRTQRSCRPRIAEQHPCPWLRIPAGRQLVATTGLSLRALGCWRARACYAARSHPRRMRAHPPCLRLPAAQGVQPGRQGAGGDAQGGHVHSRPEEHQRWGLRTARAGRGLKGRGRGLKDTASGSESAGHSPHAGGEHQQACPLPLACRANDSVVLVSLWQPRTVAQQLPAGVPVILMPLFATSATYPSLSYGNTHHSCRPCHQLHGRLLAPHRPHHGADLLRGRHPAGVGRDGGDPEDGHQAAGGASAGDAPHCRAHPCINVPSNPDHMYSKKCIPRSSCRQGEQWRRAANWQAGPAA